MKIKKIVEKGCKLPNRFGTPCREKCLCSVCQIEKDVYDETLSVVRKEIDELEFTNLLRKNKCINVNNVQDEIKKLMKSALQIPTEKT
jgi:hypothetical protein